MLWSLLYDQEGAVIRQNSTSDYFYPWRPGLRNIIGKKVLEDRWKRRSRWSNARLCNFWGVGVSSTPPPPIEKICIKIFEMVFNSLRYEKKIYLKKEDPQPIPWLKPQVRTLWCGAKEKFLLNWGGDKKGLENMKNAISISI